MLDFLNPLSDLMRTEQSFYIAFSVVLGLLVGSFLNVVIHRLPKIMEREWHANCLELQGKEAPAQTKYTLSTPRSACPNCGHQITVLENIPVISYLMLGGKCKSCKTKISLAIP